MHRIVDVSAVEICLHRQVDDCLHRRRRRCLAFFACDRLLEQFHIHLEADACNMSVLLRTEEAARPADLKIAHRNLEARAETREFLHRLQTLLRRLTEHLVAPIGEVGECHLCRASDTPAHLIELRETEAVGIVNDDGICIGDVDAVLDDARREQDIIMPLIEVHHDLLKDVLIHLPVCRGNARLGHETQQMLAHTVDALHAVVDKVDLSPTRQFALDRAAHHRIAALHDVGLHW